MTETNARQPINWGVVLFVLGGLIAVGAWFWMRESGQHAASNAQPATNPSEVLSVPLVPPVAMRSSVYVANFTGAVPPEFSADGISTTLVGARPYVGPFGMEGVNFMLAGMPAHRFVHVTFDLALFCTWNGCTHWGPDIWKCDVDGGPSLIKTTFDNCGFFNNNNSQNYPDEYPFPANVQPHAAWVGGLEHGTLGDMFSWGPQDTYDVDAIYRMDWTFPHEGSSLALKFSSHTKKPDKTFGFLSFRVEAVEKPLSMTDAQWEQAWQDLGGDPVAANAAVWKLTATGNQAAVFFQTRLASPQPTDEAMLDPLKLSRIRHILTVINTPDAQKLLDDLKNQ